MNLEDLLTKLQAERKVWQDRAEQQLTKGELASNLSIQTSCLRQASYDQGVAWGLYLSSTLILQEQLENKNEGN